MQATAVIDQEKYDCSLPASPAAAVSHFVDELCPPGVEIVGHSKGIRQVLEMAKVVANSNCNPILILGESGTGKELIARAIHIWQCGSGSFESFVAINCAALTANLLESELFGHVKGAFTGADGEKTGLFEVAAQGTIFLDEISEMAPELQPKLLRVLQEKTFRKVGGTKDIRCEATIIASSNRDLLAEVRKGTFRKDLYYRLTVFPIKIPPLGSADRRDDIQLLAEYFIENSAVPTISKPTGLSPKAVEELSRHSWPGNVRELRNVIERAVILEKSDQITPASLIIEYYGPQQQDKEPEALDAQDFSLEGAERRLIARVLKQTGWQRTEAAALLGISRATLYAKVKRYDIKAHTA